MKPQKSVKFNFIMNSILTVSTLIFPLITFPYVSRILMPSGMGKVSFATSLISYFSMFAQLGIPTYGVSACAKVRDDKVKLTRTVHELLIINLIMNVITYFALFCTLEFVPRLYDERRLYVIISFTIILTSIGMEWLYKALEQYTYITIRSIVFKVIALIAMFLLIHDESDYVLYGGISIFAASASNIFNLINVHKYIYIKPIGNYNIKRHWKAVFVFFAMACATTIYTQLDSVMLGFLANESDVGYYNAAIKIKMILASVVASLGTVLLPRASYYLENNKIKEFKKISRKSLNFVIIISIPLMVFFIIYAKETILILSGETYYKAIRPMQIIMPTLLFIGLTNILGIQILVPMGKEIYVLYSEIAGAITDLVINAWLIPKYASVGAAIGTLVAEFVVLVVQYTVLRKEVRNVFFSFPYIKIGIALVCALFASSFVKVLGLNNYFLILVISSLLFFGTYFVMLILQKELLTREIFDQIMEKVKKLKDF